MSSAANTGGSGGSCLPPSRACAEVVEPPRDVLGAVRGVAR
ncbi:hypothetical protein [Saccharopolyspora gregorii]